MIYKIRIILDAEEDIFRDVEIEDSNTLEEFHNAITQAFGFEGSEKNGARDQPGSRDPFFFKQL